MTEEHKCKECRWLTGKKHTRGIECMNPELQDKWNNAKSLWMGELRRNTARYKQPNAPACKRFEAKEETMREIIVRYNDGNDHMAVRGGEYVQDLVRCEECGLNETDDCPMVCYIPLADGGFETKWWNKPNDFCSWGEVRDE